MDQVYILEVSAEVARSAGNLAEAHKLRGYDALHLAAALAPADPGLAMATWDSDLIRAGPAAGLSLATG